MLEVQSLVGRAVKVKMKLPMREGTHVNIPVYASTARGIDLTSSNSSVNKHAPLFRVHQYM